MRSLIIMLWLVWNLKKTNPIAIRDLLGLSMPCEGEAAGGSQLTSWLALIIEKKERRVSKETNEHWFYFLLFLFFLLSHTICPLQDPQAAPLDNYNLHPPSRINITFLHQLQILSFVQAKISKIANTQMILS